MLAQSGQLLPALAAIGAAEQGGIFRAGIDGIRVVQRWFQMPDALELPRPRRPVVLLVGARTALVDELLAGRRPRLAAVVRTLDQLSKPTTRLRRVQPIRISRRSLQVVHLPACKVRAGHVPSVALAIRGQHEGTLLRADENSYLAHVRYVSFSGTSEMVIACCPGRIIGLRSSPTARQQYQAATLRYGLKRSPSIWSSLGLISVGNEWIVVQPLRTP